MKPLYRFEYDFPNEKVHKQYIKDAIQNLMSEEKLYQKYGKYRRLGNWDDFEEGFIHRLNHIQRSNPNFTQTLPESTERRDTAKSFYEASITLILTRTWQQRDIIDQPFSRKQMEKYLVKYYQIKQSDITTKWHLLTGMQGWLNTQKSVIIKEKIHAHLHWWNSIPSMKRKLSANWK